MCRAPQSNDTPTMQAKTGGSSLREVIVHGKLRPCEMGLAMTAALHRQG